MALQLQLSVAVRNARLDAIEITVGTSPKLRIYTGAIPADCATARSGTKILEITCPSDWAAAASAGSKAKSGTWSDVGLSPGGVAGYFSLQDSAGTTCHMQGTVGTASTDMIIDNTSINTGQAVTISTFTLTDGNA